MLEALVLWTTMLWAPERARASTISPHATRVPALANALTENWNRSGIAVHFGAQYAGHPCIEKMPLPNLGISLAFPSIGATFFRTVEMASLFFSFPVLLAFYGSFPFGFAFPFRVSTNDGAAVFAFWVSFSGFCNGVPVFQGFQRRRFP